MHGLYHILLVVYGPPWGHTRLKIWYNPVHDYPRRYTAKQLKTIYYSLNVSHNVDYLKGQLVSEIGLYRMAWVHMFAVH